MVVEPADLVVVVVSLVAGVRSVEHLVVAVRSAVPLGKRVRCMAGRSRQSSVSGIAPRVRGMTSTRLDRLVAGVATSAATAVERGPGSVAVVAEPASGLVVVVAVVEPERAAVVADNP